MSVHAPTQTVQLLPAETATHFLQNYQDEDGQKKYMDRLVRPMQLVVKRLK